jgi:hypothetical protein
MFNSILNFFKGKDEAPELEETPRASTDSKCSTNTIEFTCQPSQDRKRVFVDTMDFLFKTRYTYTDTSTMSSITSSSKSKDIKTVFVVISKDFVFPLGVFDTYERAKEIGDKETYKSCMIYKFDINGEISWINTPIYTGQEL